MASKVKIVSMPTKPMFKGGWTKKHSQTNYWSLGFGGVVRWTGRMEGVFDQSTLSTYENYAPRTTVLSMG